MSKKNSKLQNKKMLYAAIFVILAVSFYAHVDGWIYREGEREQMAELKKSNETINQDISMETQIEDEIKNLENEMKTDSKDGDLESSYWSR